MFALYETRAKRLAEEKKEFEEQQRQMERDNVRNEILKR